MSDKKFLSSSNKTRKIFPRNKIANEMEKAGYTFVYNSQKKQKMLARKWQNLLKPYKNYVEDTQHSIFRELKLLTVTKGWVPSNMYSITVLYYFVYFRAIP